MSIELGNMHVMQRARSRQAQARVLALVVASLLCQSAVATHYQPKSTLKQLQKSMPEMCKVSSQSSVRLSMLSITLSMYVLVLGYRDIVSDCAHVLLT